MSLRERGVTLIDALAAVAVMLVASTLMLGFLVFSLRQGRLCESRQHQILQVEKAVLRILNEYAISRASYLRPENSISGAIFPSAHALHSASLQVNTQGQLIWVGWWAYGLNQATGELWEAYQAFATPVSEGGEVTKGPSTAPSSWRRSRLASGVSELELTSLADSRLRIRVLATDTSGYRIEMTSSGVAQN